MSSLGNNTEDRAPQDRAGVRDVFGVADFRTLWVSLAQSRVGDQVARVALALLVYGETSSALYTTLVYALTYLPPLFTAPLLAGLADRYSRRDVLVGTDLVRAVLVAGMAVPAFPLPVVLALLVATTCLQPLFSAARNSVLPAMLPGDRFPVGMSVVTSTDSIAQIAGFTLGGALVAWAGDPRVALLVNAATFLVSAVLTRLRLAPYRPTSSGGPGSGDRSMLAGVRVILHDRRLVRLLGMMCMFGLFLAPEALAAPFGRQVGVGAAGVGVLMAADLVGVAVGSYLLGRLGPVRSRLLTPLALATGVPLLVTAVLVNLPAALVAWAVAGACSAYIVVAQTTFTELVPDEVRGRTIGAAAAALQTAQGIGVLVAGAVAEVFPASTAIAVCGMAGTLGVGVFAVATRGTGKESP